MMTKEERREYMRRYRAEHREQINTNARLRYKKNREKYLACQKTYYERRTAKNSKWISVDERLPKHLEKVLVCDDKQNMFTALYVAYDNGGFNWCTSVRLEHKVTHWMPLPEPPKEDT